MSWLIYRSVIAQEETWADDPNAFVADDDDYALMFNLRVASHDVVSVRVAPELECAR